MQEEFDFDTALAALQDGQGLTGNDDILTPLIRQLGEAVLQAEMATHLKAEGPANRRNGTGRKTIKYPAQPRSKTPPSDSAFVLILVCSAQSSYPPKIPSL
ncbi:MAG: hypothetical protein QM492_08990 [Rhodobacterales bacterium]